jgi:flavin-dependent dehydrogenase
VIADSRVAIVIGGNLAGCLAAKVLLQHYDRVFILEKADFDDEVGTRRGVPQEHHVHLLLLKGKQVLEEIFPGILRQLEAAGAIVADLGHDIKWYQCGRWKSRYKTGIEAHYCSRRLIDNTIRMQIRRESRVSVISGATATALMSSGKNVTGVEYIHAGTTHRCAADVVVDASGRGSRAPKWLAALFPDEKIVEERIETQLGYASRVYKCLPQFRHLWKVLLVLPSAPRQRAMGVISPIEGDRWLATTGGWFGHYPTTDPDDFLAFLSRLPARDIFDVVNQAEPLSDVYRFGMRGSVRYRYELMGRWPTGFLVIGDALCSLNPLYSQGMTLLALEVQCIRDCLKQLLAGSLSIHAVQRSVCKVVIPAWSMAKEEDMRFPEINGAHGIRMSMRQWYGASLGKLSANNRLALQTQVAVTNLVAPPSLLYHPRIVGPLLMDRLRETVHRRTAS